MKVSLTALNEWLAHPVDAGEIEQRMTGLGLAVDGVERAGEGLEDIVVGRVETVEKHPNADRLSVCTVFDGTETKHVVCGAPNVAAGGHYPFAKVGTTLPVGITLKRAKIRGEVSEGMLCSAEELGLGEDSDGILELGDDVVAGASIIEALNLTDTVFDLDITYNRPDWMSVRGVAREVAAAVGTPLRSPHGLPDDTGAGEVAELVRVSIEDDTDCPIYGARIVRGVTVGPSPSWLKTRLESIGQRSINNIVDVTNYVLLTYGQPIHGFDLSGVRGGEIHVRRARSGEKMTLLDGVERTFTDDVLLITDGEGPVAVAGIMGGVDSEVEDHTTDVLIESALFDNVRVRAGVRTIGLETDAATRFSRGVDPETVLMALDETARLMAEVGGGEVVPGRVIAGSVPRADSEVELRLARVERVLGKAISRDEITTTLERLGFSPTWIDDERVKTTSPSWRRDVHLEEDLIEDIARFHGYEHFEARNYNPSATAGVPHPVDRAIRDSMMYFVGRGFRESFTTMFQPDDEAARTRDWGWVTGEAIALVNAKSREFSMMRTSIWPGLLRVARHNLHHGHDAFALVEHGKVFGRPPAGANGDAVDGAALERLELAGLWHGPSSLGDWSRPEAVFTVFDLKGLLEGWCGHMRLVPPVVEPAEHPALDPGQTFRFVTGPVSGAAGPISKRTAKDYDLPQDVWLFSIDFEGAVGVDTVYVRHVEESRYPAVKRDLAFVLPSDVSHADVDALIRRAGGEIVSSIRLFDVYEGESIGAGKKSLAYALSFRSQERSLTGDEVDGAVRKIVKRLQRDTGAVLRDS
jgi:phenylalanyl-tRNA synthetase beta chain